MKILFIIVILFTLNGCKSLGDTVNEIRDDDYSIGCAASEAQVGIGGYGQKGEVVACKLKCSKGKLPNNYKMRYNNPRTGCVASVGYGDSDSKIDVYINEE